MRRLTLTRETLTELTTDELTAVAGGVPATGNGLTCPVKTCTQADLSQAFQTCYCCTATASCAV